MCIWVLEYICVCQRPNEAQCVPLYVIKEQIGDLKHTRDSQFCQVYRERMGVCLAWQLHPINCTTLSKLHSNHLAQTETKMHCSDGGGGEEVKKQKGEKQTANGRKTGASRCKTDRGTSEAMDKTWIFGYLWTLYTVYLSKLVSGLSNLLLCYLLLSCWLNGKRLCLNFERHHKQQHYFLKMKTILNPSATLPLAFPSKWWLTSALTWGCQLSPSFCPASCRMGRHS